MNRGEELGDGPAPLADFDHGSLFEGAPGPRRFVATAELSRRSHFMPIEMRMESGGLHAHFDRHRVIRRRAAAGSANPPTRKRSEKSALMASVWGKLWIARAQRAPNYQSSVCRWPWNGVSSPGPPDGSHEGVPRRHLDGGMEALNLHAPVKERIENSSAVAGVNGPTGVSGARPAM